MPKTKTVVVSIPGMIEETDLNAIRELGLVEYHELEMISSSDLAMLCKDADVLMLNYDVVKRLDEEFYSHEYVKNLRSISTDITGMDWANPQIAKVNGLTLQHIPHYSSESVAETILCEILLHTRQRLLEFRDLIASNEPEARQGINLMGRTAGVIGYGSIGSRVATILKCLGMNVLVWNRTEKADINLVSMEEIFQKAEIICLAMATEMDGQSSNKSIINKNLLKHCSNTVIVNLAGQHLVNNEDMVEALKNENVRGYTVEGGKELRSSEMSDFPQVHMPPHNAWKSPESLENLKNTWVLNTLSSLKGDPKNIFTQKL